MANTHLMASKIGSLQKKNVKNENVSRQTVSKHVSSTHAGICGEKPLAFSSFEQDDAIQLNNIQCNQRCRRAKISGATLAQGAAPESRHVPCPGAFGNLGKT